jgi:hypothetical protein
MRHPAKILGALLIVLTLSACMAGSPASEQAASGGELYQLLLGLWHGIIAPITLILEIINRFAPHALPWHAHLYETKAAGAFYDLGFYLGLAGSPIVIINRGWR